MSDIVASPKKLVVKHDGSPLGILTAAYWQAETRQERYTILKGSAELQKHFRLSDYQDLEAKDE